MGEYLDQIPEQIQSHIKEITKTSGMPDNEESVEMIAQAWIEKKETFEREIANAAMEEIDNIEKDNTKGALALTYSGSLISIGPLTEEGRTASYTSIGLRTDVPDTLDKDGSVLANDILINEPIEFETGPIKSSSHIYKIAVCTGELTIQEETEKINNATMILAEEFVKVNQTIITD